MASRQKGLTFEFNMELNGERITRKRYPNLDDYFDAIFEANKTTILNRFRLSVKTMGPTAAKKLFVGNLKDKVYNLGLTPSKALDSARRGELLTPAHDRGVTNIVSGLQKYGKYREFREMTKENGKYTKMDWQKWKMNEEDEWIYDDKIKVNVSNSPKQITLIDLTGKYRAKKQKAQ